MGRASLVRCASGLLALGVGVRVAAAASLPTIAWDAPAGCPDADALTAELARHLDPAAIAADSSIRVRAWPSGSGWSVRVAIGLDGRTQERTLAVDTCEAAVRAAAFVIAIAVDPSRRDPPDLVPAPPEVPTAPPADDLPQPPPGAAADPPLGPPPDAPLEPPPDEPAPPSPPRPSVRGLVQLGPALQAGMLPVGAGLSAAFGLLWPRARLTFGYTRWFTTEVRRPVERPYGGEFSAHAGHLRGGPALRAGPLELPLHLGLELGGLGAVGIGGDDNYRATTLWAAATLGAGLGWAPRALRGHAALVVLAEAAVALRRPRYIFADDLEVHRVGPAAFRGFLLLEARFP